MTAPDSTLAEAKSVLLGMAAEGDELQRALGGSVANALAGWMAAQYALAARQHLATAEGARRWEVLRASVQDLAELRRGDHTAIKLQLEREHLDLLRAKALAAREVEFRAWLQRPEVRKEFFPEKGGVITSETIEKIEKELNLL